MSICFNFNVKKNANQIQSAIDDMSRVRKNHPSCTCIVYMGGIQNGMSSREKMMHTICHQGLTCEESIAEAAREIVKYGSTFSDSIFFMEDEKTVKDITARVFDKIHENGDDAIINKINTCRGHMAIAGKNSAAILYVDGLKRSENDTLNEEVIHSGATPHTLIRMASKMVKIYGYNGRIYILDNRTNKVKDVTIDVMYFASR